MAALVPLPTCSLYDPATRPVLAAGDLPRWAAKKLKPGMHAHPLPGGGFVVNCDGRAKAASLSAQLEASVAKVARAPSLPSSSPDPTRSPATLRSLADVALKQAEGVHAAAGALTRADWTHPDRFLAVAVLARELAKVAADVAAQATFLEGVAAARQEVA